MRISDWSSDVCSSDLDALKEGRLKMTQRLPISAHAAAQPYGIDLRAGQTISVHDAILAAITKSANNAAVVLAEALGGTESKFERQLYGCTAKWDAKTQTCKGKRSEEHTSELQSLMRNSYAVFCLKKKNNK